MEFSELFAQGVREVLPLARAKRIVLYFDYHGPFITLPGGTAELKGAIHRILRGMIDCIDAGFVLFEAEVAPPSNGSSRIRVRAAGTGALDASEIEPVLCRLHLEQSPHGTEAHADEKSRAAGVCPMTGGAVEFVNAGPDGLLLSLELTTPASEVPGVDPLPDASGASAWLVSPIPGALASVGHRLRRLGWRSRSFNSLEQASALLAAGQLAASELPMLLVVAESTRSELPQMERLATAHPAVWPVLAVLAGSPTVQARGETPVDIRVLPLSPIELEHFTSHVDPRTSTAESRETSPSPLYVQEVQLILVVDDSAVNQLVARAQLETLGYDVHVAGNGAEACEACRRQPPDMVLMDLDMPVMGGLGATARLRSWQRDGRLPPFPIVAATSGDGGSRRSECLAAGMDGYLAKPLNLRRLADEIHRVLPARPAAYGSDSPPLLAG